MTHAAALLALPLAASSSAPFWIAGWVIVLALLIGLPTYYTRKRRKHSGR